MKHAKRLLWAVPISLALIAVGCSRSDSQIASDIQSKILSDNNVPDKQVTITANKGVVTLSGTVTSDAARTAAAADAGQVSGVKTVINNLEVESAAVANSTLQPPAIDNRPDAEGGAPPAAISGVRRQKPSPQRSSGETRLRTTVPPPDDNNAPPSDAPVQTAAAPPAPTPVPAPQKIIIPTGTRIAIRVNQELDSEKAQVGDTFTGTVSAPINIDDQVAVPKSADVEGRVVDVKSAGRFAGGSLLTLELTKLTVNGKSYSIQTDPWSKSGNGNGKSTATKVGGGAVLGAVLGGIFGGGKGAAIGTVAGAGAGTAGSAVDKAHQIILKPEATVEFKLQNTLTL